MREKLKPLLTKFSPFVNFIRRYALFCFFIAVLLIFSFLVFRINVLTNAQPTDDQITEKLKTVQRPHIDESTVNKIKQLQDHNVQVKALFDEARNNPFSE